jgi:hypothetical protein
LAARVEDYLGRGAFDAASPRVLEVSVEATPENRLRALVKVIESSGTVLGERELVTEDSTCESLEEPLVLAVALLADSDLGADTERKTEPEPPPPPPEEDEHADREPLIQVRRVVRAEPPRPPEPWRTEVDLGLLGADGLLPEFAFGGEVGVLVDPPVIPGFRLRAVGLLPQTLELSPRGSIELRAYAWGLMACPLSERGDALRFDACAGADVVLQHAESEGLDGARSTSAAYVQGDVLLRVAFDLSGAWFAVLNVNAAFPVQPPEFVFRRDGKTVSVFRSAEGSLLASAGLGVRWGD